MPEQQKQAEANGHAQNKCNHKGPYQILQNMGRRQGIEQNPVGRRRRILDARGRVIIVRVRRDAEIVGIPMKNSENTEAESADNENKKQNKEGDVFEGPGAVIEGDVNVLVRIGFVGITVIVRRIVLNRRGIRGFRQKGLGWRRVVERDGFGLVVASSTAHE